MFPVFCLVFYYISIVKAGVSINPLHVYDLARGKQTMVRPKQELDQNFNIGDRGMCLTLKPEDLDTPAVYFIDFREKYPIVLINITVYTKVQTKGTVRIVIDDKLCAVPDLKNGSNVIMCSSDVAGRVFALHTKLDITICAIQVFTCSLGKQGRTCSNECEKGTYGMACRPCNCRNNEICRLSDGFCPSGCQGVHSDKRYNCYYASVSRHEFGHFASIAQAKVKSQVLLPFLRKNEIFLRKTDSQSTSELHCAILKPDDKRSAVVELLYRSNDVLNRIVITYCDFDIPPPFSIYIVLDGHSCFGLTKTKVLALGTYTFICQRKGISGNILTIKHTSYDLSSNATISIGLSEITLLACAKGFYGPKCKQHCNCLGSVCDPVNGECPSHICASFAKGSNCASINVAQMHQVIKTENIGDPLTIWGSTGKTVSLSFNFLPSIYDHNDRKWISWYAVQLDGVYHIQGVTLHISEDHISNFRMFAVFTDTETDLDSYFYRGNHQWHGLGCMKDNDQQLGTVIDVKCPGHASVITIVTYGYSPFITASVGEIEVWTCEDGTFGPLCEGICNCRDEDEVCNMASGECISGCAEGFGGVDCQLPCTVGTSNDSCWKECQCREQSRGCGPGVILCEDEKCIPGWMGVTCDIQCPNGWYGFSCVEKCGSCIPDDRNLSCNPINGFCENGCTNDLMTPTCKPDDRRYFDGTAMNIPNETLEMLRFVVYALVISLVAIAILCLCVRLFLIKQSDPKELTREHSSTHARRALNYDVNEKIMRDHRDYHEDFMHKKTLQQATEHEKPGCFSFIRKMFSFRTSKMHHKTKHTSSNIIFGIKKDYPRKSLMTDRCTPLENNAQVTAEQKVANWILRQDFSVLINRRQETLKHYKSNILEIKESNYTTSSVNLTKEELDKLYDEVGILGIP